MQEIFNNIRSEVKDTAETAWQLAVVQKDAIQAARFLNTVIER